MRSGVLWDLLRQGYKSSPTRGSPDFGGPSFPFPFPLPVARGQRRLAGGDWREPSSRGGWSPGRGSRSDDDDFTTGGSF